MTYIAVSDDAPIFRGGARGFWGCKDPEIILSGPYETGKTFCALTKLHTLLCLFPKAVALMTRKTKKSLVATACKTYEKKVLPVEPQAIGTPVTVFGGENPEFYQYPNGSRLVVGGMDNPDKTLSAEYDFAYINQAEELPHDSWQAVVRATTGRAGNTPYTQILADCNPGPPKHWILERERLRMFESRHKDNPMLWDESEADWTPQGKLSMTALLSMTGIRKKRGYQGLWVGAEGQVYESFDPAIHVLDSMPLRDHWTRFRAIDFGVTNPFCCQWWCVDHDGRMFMYREVYMTGRSVKNHARQINELSRGERIAYTVCDHDASDRLTLKENGIATIPAKKAISAGIGKVEDRLALAADGKPRLFFLSGALVEKDETLGYNPSSTEEEFGAYVWPEGVDGRPLKEVPVDLHNHGMDTLRYAVMSQDTGVKRSRPRVRDI